MSSSSSDSDSGDDANNQVCIRHSVTAESNIGDEDSAQVERLAQKETVAVFRLRLLVMLLLLAAALAVSVCVYWVTRKGEHEAFKSQFAGSAEKILASFEGIISQKMGAIGSLGLALTAYAKNLNETWPYVTMQEFDRRAASARLLSNALHMSVMPVVAEHQREEWERYSIAHGAWFEEGKLYQAELEANGYVPAGQRLLTEALDAPLIVKPESSSYALRSQHRSDRELQWGEGGEDDGLDRPSFEPWGFGDRLYQFTEYFDTIVEPLGIGPYTPVWLSSPVTALDSINMNLITYPGETGEFVQDVLDTHEIALSSFQIAPAGDITSENFQTRWQAGLLSTFYGKPVIYDGSPLSALYLPIFDEYEGKNQSVVAVMSVHFLWASYFEDILPPNTRGVVLVLENGCQEPFTYEINGEDVTPLGAGDLHNRKFNHLQQSNTFGGLLKVNDGTAAGLKLRDPCGYKVSVYPSEDFYHDYITNMPWLVALAVAFVFIFTMFMFTVYDRIVERRQRIVMTRAEQTTAIVASMFPDTVRNRLYQGSGAGNNGGNNLSANHRLKSFLLQDGSRVTAEAKPLADLFPHTTVLFSDIEGFTAWSSSRDPSQVFILLQSVYHEFDTIAERRKVFKVETIGDAYVAVTGLPTPQPNHAVIMARFAQECILKMSQITQVLELSLGPDTSELAMRFGLHSGPVIAGVLRGDRPRFQLFGDTVNTASRMESTGTRNKIQCSYATADLLRSAGKDHWLERRSDSVLAKGKGILNTFWVLPLDYNRSTTSARDVVSANPVAVKVHSETEKTERLIEWATEMLQERIKNVVAMHMSRSKRKKKKVSNSTMFKPAAMPLQEVAEVIVLPDFDAKTSRRVDPEGLDLGPDIIAQIRQFVSMIAATYNDNEFHNFQHACQVTMATDKFLKRIVAPDIDLEQMGADETTQGALASHLHDYTHGINSDALTLAAIVFSALIHDSDHRGISNTQLGKEDKQLVDRYQNKSIAEQNSLDISWNLLMSDEFSGLRDCLFGQDQEELKRFRQVVVNVVLATDIFDKELNDLRKSRWAKAFEGSKGDRTGLKATIVIEYIIQASDVCHTMQHWHVYRKWNKRLFKEMHTAWKAGRMGADPSTFWYNGELGFFDNYIIPLSKKLKECGVFGVSSDECLTYAMQNRAEWEARGEQIVMEMMEEISVAKTVKEISLGEEGDEILV